jgi:hypothetical protein
MHARRPPWPERLILKEMSQGSKSHSAPSIVPKYFNYFDCDRRE